MRGPCCFSLHRRCNSNWGVGWAWQKAAGDVCCPPSFACAASLAAPPVAVLLLQPGSLCTVQRLRYNMMHRLLRGQWLGCLRWGLFWYACCYCLLAKDIVCKPGHSLSGVDCLN